MKAHRFDPLSAILGIASIVIGSFVMLGDADPLSSNLGPWLATGVLGIGIALLPWSRRHDDPPTREASDIPAE